MNLRIINKNFNIKSFTYSIAFFVMGLIVAMSITSKYDVHPDEIAHNFVADYFTKNWLYPPVGHPDAAYTYSGYGYSYIDEYDISYLFAGKFYEFTESIWRYEYLSFRFFQIILFLILLVFFVRKKEGYLFLIPILITPQVWYIFSYFNGDAFPFTISMFAAYQISSSNSMTSKYLLSDKFTISWEKNPILLGVFVGFLLISKKNFYMFVLFIGFYALWLIFLQTKNNKKEIFIKWCLILLVAVLTASPRVIQDIYVNGFDKSTKRIEYAEKVASDNFKPSNYGTDKARFGLAMKNKGVLYSEIFSKSNWHVVSFQSFVGFYGYMTISSPDFYYDSIAILYTILFFAIIYYHIRFKGLPGISLVLSGILVILATIFVSSYHSWTSDFQPQGRYLFSILPILTVLIFKISKKISFGFYLPWVLITLLGLYSYIFTALQLIPKS